MKELKVYNNYDSDLSIFDTTEDEQDAFEKGIWKS